MLENHPDPLNPREQTILRLIAEGSSNQQIADQLSISLNTVKWHLKNIFSKLGVKRRTQAVKLATTQNLLYSPEAVATIRLPIPVTPFIGRKNEVEQILALLNSSESRLVSITGLGGIGKTRLAIEIARRYAQLTDFSTYFVTLDGIQQVSDVVPTIAQGIGFQFGGKHDLTEQLLTGLRDRIMLLVVDNCEHVLDAVPIFAEMLAVSSKIYLLTTSRERLNLQGEAVFIVNGLPYNTSASPNIETDASHLFLQTARRFQLDFNPSQEDYEHIHQICQLVEGMPLAIELAAGWIEVMSLEEITKQVRAGIDFLESSARDIPNRHQSMTAVFEHSWQLMSTSEQKAFKKLCVFRGGFYQQPAEKIANVSPKILRKLVSMSLINKTSARRWKIHELLRQFGEEKLWADSENYDQTMRDFCQYYGQMMREQQTLFESNLLAFAENMPDLFHDHDNILRAWHLTIDLSLLSSLGNFTTIIGLLLQSLSMRNVANETLQRIRDLFNQNASEISLLDKLSVFAQSGWFAYTSFELDDALSFLEQAHRLTRDSVVQTSPQTGLVFSFLGQVYHAKGALDLAEHYTQLAIEHCLKSHFRFGEATSYFLIALIKFEEGNYVIANEFAEKSNEILENAKVYHARWTSALQANIQMLLGNTDAAVDLWLHYIPSLREISFVDPILLTVVGLGMLLDQNGQSELALQFTAIAIQHPQIQAPSLRIALHILDRYKSRFSDTEIDAIMTNASQGKLTTPYLDSNFVIDSRLVDRLLTVLKDLTFKK